MFDLNNVAIFVKIVEAGSIAAAAEQLNMPSNTVGRHLAQLEEDLGLSLVQRTTRKLHVTPAGNHYYEQCVRQIAVLDEASRRLAETMREPSGHLRVAAPTSLAEILDMATVADFLRKYPRLELELHLGEDNVNLLEKGIDIALCVGPLASSTLKARHLINTERVLVASSAYLNHAGPIDSPEDLVHHDCLVDLSVPGKNLWHLANGEQNTEVRVRGRFSANSPFVLLRMARNDLGIALLATRLVQDDLSRGTLMRVLPRFHVTGEHFYAVYPSHRQHSRAVQAFISFMIEWTRAVCTPVEALLPENTGWIIPLEEQATSQ